MCKKIINIAPRLVAVVLVAIAVKVRADPSDTNLVRGQPMIDDTFDRAKGDNCHHSSHDGRLHGTSLIRQFQQTSHLQQMLDQASQTFSKMTKPKRELKGVSKQEKKTKSETKQTKKDSCQAELDVCLEEKNKPSLLFVQMGDNCEISRDEQGKYTLTSSEMAKETWWFTDRPYQVGGEMETRAFFNSFDNVFRPDNGGKPNAAFTFGHDQDPAKFNGPLIAVMVEAAIMSSSVDDNDADPTDGGDSNVVYTYTYKLGQSAEQENVMPLSAFFQGDGPSTETFTDCSIFIDEGDIWDFSGQDVKDFFNKPVSWSNKVVCTCERYLDYTGQNQVSCQMEASFNFAYTWGCKDRTCNHGKSFATERIHPSFLSWNFDDGIIQEIGTALGCLEIDKSKYNYG